MARQKRQPCAETDALAEKLGQTILRLRTADKMSLGDLSQSSGVAKSMISQIEKNETNPSLATLSRLSQASLNLRANMNVGRIQTRQMTMDWYIRHRKELVDMQTGETFESDLLALIDSLDTLPNKKPLLRTLKNLARRDSERKESDIGIVSTSKERWG